MYTSIKDLEMHMLECSELMPDGVDQVDYKNYILPLFCYKVISDDFENQFEQYVEEYGEEFARRPNLYDVPIVPEGHLWDDLRAVTDNVDEAINDAFHALTEENPSMEGVFRADYISEESLDDTHLTRIIEHLSEYRFNRENFPPDRLGEVYMQLVRDFAEKEGKEGGKYFTRPKVVQLCVRLAKPFSAGEIFHDPVVGSGGMLIEAARDYQEKQDGDPSKLRFSGQQAISDIAAIAKMNLFINRISGDIKRGNTLRSPEFTVGEGELERFDYVLTNIPFSEDWDKNQLKNDPYNRFDWHEKLPRKDRADYAYIMHIEKQLKKPHLNGTGGQASIVIPHGVLFREKEERYRKKMLENGLVEAVIGLPDNLFHKKSNPIAILTLNADKKIGREGEVIFIHAADEAFYRELSNRDELTENGMDHIIRNVSNWETVEGVSRTVSMDEIRGNDYNLNIALYIDTTEPEEDVDVEKELEKLRELEAELDDLKQRRSSYMEALNYE